LRRTYLFTAEHAERAEMNCITTESTEDTGGIWSNNALEFPPHVGRGLASPSAPPRGISLRSAASLTAVASAKAEGSPST